jgi:membrane protein DedA with SNARE-associated domain
VEILSDPGRLLDAYGIVAIFLIILLKEAGAPIPLPGDVLMILAGAKAAAGSFGLLPLIVAVIAAALIGSLVQYLLARGPARQLFYRYGRYVGLSAERLDRASGSVSRRGWLGVTAGRLTPGVRTIIVIACGLAAMPLRVFTPGIVVGAGLFFVLHALLGYFVGPPILGLLQNLNLPILPLVLVFALVGLVVWLVRRRRGRAGNALAKAIAWADAGCPVCALASTLERFEPTDLPLGAPEPA